MKLSEWRGVSKEGEIPEELLPCRYLQYRWRIHHSFDISPYLGIGGGQLSMTFEMQCGKLHSVDTVTFLLTTLRDPILGWVAAF
ncbi:MAG: hypothetical protein H5T86_10630, partial [Armatimonadetes bacterium]|nr:hypothetical protein [Armatimonadota bacterium]